MVRDMTKEVQQNLSIKTRSLFADSSIFLSITLTRLSLIRIFKSLTVMLIPEDGGGSEREINLMDSILRIPTIHWYIVFAIVVQSFWRMTCASLEINVWISEVPFCLSKQITIPSLLFEDQFPQKIR